MRILHIIESLDFGGAEKVTVSLANALADSHDVAICCLKRVGALGTEVDGRIRVFCLDKGEGNDYRLPWRLARLIRKETFNVVHTHNWAVFLEGGLGGWLGGAPRLVHTVHGPYIDYPPSWRSRAKIALRHRLERGLARRFHRIVTVSDAIGGYVRQEIRLPAERLMTIHNGIPAVPANPAPRPERRQITFMTVGRLAAVKNHAMMLRAFQKLAASNAEARLIIVGDGPERSALEGFVHDQDMENRVQFRGFLNNVDELLREADVFVLTSRYEGISIALLEAMRAGLPAIGTAVGGVPETLLDGKTGILVPPEDDEALLRAMKRLAGSKPLRHEMGRSGYDYFMREFSLANMLERYRQLYVQTA